MQNESSRQIGSAMRKHIALPWRASVFAGLLAAFAPGFVTAHEGHHHPDPPHRSTAANELDTAEPNHYLHLFKTLIARWPTSAKDDLVTQAWREHQFIHRTPAAPSQAELRESRNALLQRLERSLPSLHLDWNGSTLKQRTPSSAQPFCRTIAAPLLVTVHNETADPATLRLVGNAVVAVADNHPVSTYSNVFAGSSMVFAAALRFPEGSTLEQYSIAIEAQDQSQQVQATIPVRLSDPGMIRGTVREGNAIVPARVTVTCSDGVCRYGGEFATKATFTDKPIIYPPIGGSQKTLFFYTDGSFDLAVPPGTTQVSVERGFHHRRQTLTKTVEPGKSVTLNLSCDQLVDLPQQGWVSGDTHVHWVTNQWNVDEPLELLALVQRAEGLCVANNLTLLQRYANQAFIKPSQAPMGPVQKFSDSQFHIQMGEEYRNEDLYGHLCFLNLDWLVQPIGTGAIIAGPDALDYPLNRTAIEACRRQGGLSIEAHGTGGNKDVPVNVIHNLTDSLDQMEPEMYYRLLDCGFRLPLTNGSDHPARTLGIARAYVNIDGGFTYAHWIDGIRRGRTFTTSGPIVFLSVNDSQIGDTIATGAGEPLEIKAKVISRDPIGIFEIVSNGEVIANIKTDQTTAELNLTVPSEQSRWIVARCSNRTDGRADFGFGNFNAITGRGIAHTSPIYVSVDGFPRFDPAAAAYWQDRMRLHVHEVQAKGRFANQEQRREAVDYLQRGIDLYGQLKTFIDSSRARHESFPTARQRLSAVVRRFGRDRQSVDVLRLLMTAATERELHAALEPLVLFHVSVNPESRVKIQSLRNKVQLHQQRPQRFLVKIENTAGITAPLNLSAIDLAVDPPAEAKWCTIEVVDSPFTSRYFTGASTEYKVVQITPHTAGLRELRITGDAGQGTQDLGFRATTDVLLDVQAKRLPSVK